MRCSVTVCAVLFLCCPAMCQDRSAAVQPGQFEIGRHTFFDFGPPFNFYEIFVVRPSATGTSVERITLTPPGQKCVAPAEVKAASATTSESVAKLLGDKNPCTIPEKGSPARIETMQEVFSFQRCGCCAAGSMRNSDASYSDGHSRKRLVRRLTAYTRAHFLDYAVTRSSGRCSGAGNYGQAYLSSRR